ncbi:MAG: hypothetical protein DRJ50_07380, partial [Actinobacteria bacterium]
MTAGWVAAATRGRSLLKRTVGPEGARSLAEADSWPAARAQLATTIYGTELEANSDRRSARRAAAITTVWQLRVLAGWLPPASGGLARLFVAPMEIGNIEHHVATIVGREPTTPLPLGSLGVAWPAVARATSLEQVRHVLSRSPWGDPGSNDPAVLGFGLRVSWARRLARQVPTTIECAM